MNHFVIGNADGVVDFKSKRALHPAISYLYQPSFSNLAFAASRMSLCALVITTVDWEHNEDSVKLVTMARTLGIRVVYFVSYTPELINQEYQQQTLLAPQA